MLPVESTGPERVRRRLGVLLVLLSACSEGEIIGDTDAGGHGGGSGSSDAGLLSPTTCASNSYWTMFTNGSPSMNPGYACRACHLGQNFQGQNPNKESKSERAYFFIGTVFPSAHEKDLCNSPPPAGAKVEILNKDGTVGDTLLVNSVGNFFSSTVTTPVVLPYTARLVANGKTKSMATGQTSGDCNSCHTEQGASGAPGRIFWP
jgi:hypothetical protein